MALNIKNPRVSTRVSELAEATGEPLLFKGTGYTPTDVEPA